MSSPIAPPAFHVLIKPTGSICNLACDYCFFLSKEKLYPGSRFRMSDDILAKFVRPYLESQQLPEVTIAWQGGEPTLMGLDFFRRSVQLVEEARSPGMRISYTIQTNGTTLDDAWGSFFREHDFLVGLSLDGPGPLHDAFRRDANGGPTFERVVAGWRVLQDHGVRTNILAAVHAANGDHAIDVYRFLRDEIGAAFLQFIPIVERDTGTGFREGAQMMARSVRPEQYGAFLSHVFDEWILHDVGKIFVQAFDTALAAWAGQPTGLCVSSPECGNAMVLEHNGDLYSCDHFVEPEWLLGNIADTHLEDMVASKKQRGFGRAKSESLPRQCQECRYLFACHGGCPKDRLLTADNGEPGLNYLCQGYRTFFQHIDGQMRFMASRLEAGGAPAEIMPLLRRQERELHGKVDKSKRNDHCPCGSGRKVKHCHGR